MTAQLDAMLRYPGHAPATGRRPMPTAEACAQVAYFVAISQEAWPDRLDELLGTIRQSKAALGAVVRGQPEMATHSGVEADTNERHSLGEPFGGVELKDGCGHSANVRTRDDGRPVQCKVIEPALCTWIEEWGQHTGLAIDRCEVGSLGSIAERTRERKVVQGRRTAMLLSDDVLDLERKQGCASRERTILTASIRPRRNVPAQSCRHI